MAITNNTNTGHLTNSSQSNDPNCDSKGSGTKQGPVVRAEADVKRIQEWAMGPQAADGMWGNNTIKGFKEKISDIQKANGIEQTGKLDEATKKAIRAQAGNEIADALERLEDKGITGYKPAPNPEECEVVPNSSGGAHLPEGDDLPPVPAARPANPQGMVNLPQAPAAVPDGAGPASAGEPHIVPGKIAMPSEMPRFEPPPEIKGIKPAEMPVVEPAAPAHPAQMPEVGAAVSAEPVPMPHLGAFAGSDTTFAGNQALLQEAGKALAEVGMQILERLFGPIPAPPSATAASGPSSDSGLSAEATQIKPQVMSV